MMHGETIELYYFIIGKEVLFEIMKLPHSSLSSGISRTAKGILKESKATSQEAERLAKAE